MIDLISRSDVYGKAVHYLANDLMRRQTPYVDLPSDWFDEQDRDLDALLCYYFIKHGRGHLLDRVIARRSKDWDHAILLKAAVYFSLIEGNEGPLVAVSRLDIGSDQRNLVWALRARFAYAQKNVTRAFRFAVLGRAGSPYLHDALTRGRMEALQIGDGLHAPSESVTVLPGDTTVVKMF